jgi:putative transposase
MPPPRYPSDLSDSEWAILEPLLSSTEKRGRPLKWTLRQVADAVFYLLRSGCSWRMLPREYPPWQTVYYHFRKWRIDGRLRRAHDRLREAVREAEGRDRDPSAAVIDSQVVKTTPVGGLERGYDGAKRMAGRKRRILVDTGGLVLTACVHGADLPDRDGGRRLLEDGEELARMGLVWADGAYTGGYSARGCGAGWGGAWKCRVTRTGSCGATVWGRSRAASRCYLADRW